MIRINENFLKLQASYLFSDIAKRISVYQEANPDKSIIKLGIGDVTEPLPQACRDAFHSAIDEMGTREGFHGYGPEQGYSFLREAIAENDFQARGADISADEIFVSDGAKCDSGNFQEIFAEGIKVAVADPVYPVYVDTNVMAGRSGGSVDGRYQGFVYLESKPENGYIPAIPSEPVDLIYLCFPNNPTGATATKEQLSSWVEYAKECGALILYDAAYVAFVRDSSLPQSIYEVPGAKDVAIEFRSFSKNAGFTGTRCAYTVVPKEMTAADSQGEQHSIHALWNRRHCTKFNGVSYPVQKAAEAVYSEAGKAQVEALTDFYLENAKIVKAAIEELGYSCVGGDNSPYIWINARRPSWEFFDHLLNEAGVVCTPGAGFGFCGEGHIRISAFNSRENVENAMERIRSALAK
ncbi:MAG: LL-diaminopimelate aminotransferase [Verrucomicrobiota bacterium]|nr:LL-diaminopimelate aminotransferase [Verrucomicrobiota bacterium]